MLVVNFFRTCSIFDGNPMVVRTKFTENKSNLGLVSAYQRADSVLRMRLGGAESVLPRRFV